MPEPKDIFRVCSSLVTSVTMKKHGGMNHFDVDNIYDATYDMDSTDVSASDKDGFYVDDPYMDTSDE